MKWEDEDRRTLVLSVQYESATESLLTSGQGNIQLGWLWTSYLLCLLIPGLSEFGVGWKLGRGQLKWTRVFFKTF